MIKKASITIIFLLILFLNFNVCVQASEDEILKSPVFGKVDSTIKGGVSTYRYVPETLQLAPKKKDVVENDTIALIPHAETNTLSDLEKTRHEIQKAEVEGLNFIQPSLGLSKEEQDSIDEFFSRNEQEQLLGLWQSTIERNKTIQYIIQKLAPSDSAQEKRTLLSKTIGAAIFLPFYALSAVSNNSAAQYGSELGSRVLGTVIQGKMQKNQTQLQLSQTESIVLFMMIDEVAERLRQRYHSYKKVMIEKTLAQFELEEAKQDNLQALESNANEAQILANIQRRAIEREVRKLDTESRYFKNSLIELAGIDSVKELDKQLTVELAATKNIPLDRRVVQ